MKEIAITGGKGGTGKSSFALILASKLRRTGKKVILVDLDVDCPNDHLIAGLGLENEEPVSCEVPVIDEEKCTRCGKCISSCRSNALYKIKDDAPKFYAELCNSCGLCWRLCPVGAISIGKQEVGQSYECELANNIWLVSGVVKTGRLESESVVTAAKERAKKLAGRVKADYILYDTAAGTHCTVVHALLGTEKAYVVTEPTRLGEHDSRIMLEVLEKLGIPAEMVINRAGLSDEGGIVSLAEDKNVRISYRIAYSEELARAYSSGRLIESFKEHWLEEKG